MPIDNPFFAQILTRQLLDDARRRAADAPVRYEAHERQRRSHVLDRLRRALRRTS